MEYIQRHAQRIPLANHKKRKTGVINTKTTVISRKRQREEERDHEKWQTGENKPSSTNKFSHKEKLLKDWDDVMTGVKLPEGADVDDLLNELVSLKQSGFDEREHEMLKMMRDGKRLAALRQLGCKRCNSYRKCAWVSVLEVLQFNAIPPSDCRTVDDGFGWNTHVLRAKEALKKSS